jgi:hypothetical protein
MCSYDFWDQVLRADNSSLAGDIRKEMKVNSYSFTSKLLLLFTP